MTNTLGDALRQAIEIQQPTQVEDPRIGLLQMAMMAPQDRNNPRPGRMPQEMGGGGVSKEPSSRLQDAATSYAQGKMNARDVQKVFKDEGWTVDLRRGKYEIEAFDPLGKQHFIAP